MSTVPQTLPLSNLKLSQTQAQIERRAHFNKDALAELSESIKSVGLLAPIVARPVNGHFEIVAGERRYLAAKKAGLEEVSVNIRELTDEQVLKVQLIENLQREGLHELAEAEGYEGLQKLGHTVDEMADMVGKSKATIYARMKLLALFKGARKAFYDGSLTASTALLLARIPHEDLQNTALKEITSTTRFGNEQMSVREATRHVHDNYMLKLSIAGFKTEDASLVPAAGACGPCPKRTGSQPQLFGDVKGADVCTDPLCFKAKLAAHNERAKSEALARGQKVISGTEAKKVAPHGANSSLDGFVSLDAHDYTDSKNRTFRQILGKTFEPVLLEDPKSGKLVEVAPKAAVKKSSPAARVNPQSAQEKRAKLEGEYRAELFRQVRTASMARSQTLLRVELEEAASRLFDRLDHDSKRRLQKVLEWEEPESPVDINEMTGAQLAQFIRDCTLASELHAPTWSNTPPASLEDAAADLKIDTKKIRKEIADRKNAKPPAAKKPAPAKAAAPKRPPPVYVKSKKKPAKKK